MEVSVPYNPPRPCVHPGCPALVRGGNRCTRHLREVRRQADSRRGSSAARGYGAAWQRARARFLRANPFCVECRKEGRIEVATVVDHIVPHRGDPERFWDEANWQPLCKPHHDRKTARGQ